MSSAALHLVVIRCEDLERSRAFYKALGLELRPEQHGDGPQHHACDVQGVVLELYPRGTHPPTTGLRLGLTVDDVSALVQAVRVGGVGEVVRATGALEEALVRDPDGNAVHLVTTTASAPRT